MPVKYVFVTGGVVSGLGKGITAASLGRLLKARGYKVTMQKFDPYINIDPGTMNPIQHGEVFVTDDGAETDLDLGHYERFIDESLDKNSNVTTGKVYWSVLQKERRGDYGGGTVQVIPHITNEIKSRFYRNFTDPDMRIAIIEVGGTVGDIESQPFLESIRQFQHEIGHENAILIHVTLIPYLSASQEMKTKPTQASVKELQGMGIQPDIIVCRSEHTLDHGIKDKIALFCNVPTSHVLQNLDVEYLYGAGASGRGCLRVSALKMPGTGLGGMGKNGGRFKDAHTGGQYRAGWKIYTASRCIHQCGGGAQAWRYSAARHCQYQVGGLGAGKCRKCS